MARMIAFAVAFASFATGGFADKVPDQAEDECGDACLAKNSLLQVKKSKGGDSDQADLEAQRYEEYAKSNYSALSDDQKAEVDELHELAGGACLHGNDIKRWNEWGGKYQFHSRWRSLCRPRQLAAVWCLLFRRCSGAVHPRLVALAMPACTVASAQAVASSAAAAASAAVGAGRATGAPRAADAALDLKVRPLPLPLAWAPEEAAPDDELVVSIAERLASFGWCELRLQTADADDDGVGLASAEAAGLDLLPDLRAELVEDYLGRGASGRVAQLPPSVDEEQESLASSSFLRQRDGDLEELILAFSECSAATDVLGFDCHSRLSSLVWTPVSKEKEAFQPEPLTDQELRAGVLDEHIAFLRRRRLCALLVADIAGADASDGAPGGHLRLHGTGGTRGTFFASHLHCGCRLPEDDILLPLSMGSLILFRHDLILFSYEPPSSAASAAPSGGSLPVLLLSWILDAPPRFEVATEPLEPSGVGTETRLAIAGTSDLLLHSMACRLPAGANHPERYWAALASGADGLVRIPGSRFDVDKYCTSDQEPAHGLSYARHGGFCADADIFGFDQDFFGLTSAEVHRMEPAQRVVLEVGYECLAAGGWTKSRLMGRPMGVYVGDSGSNPVPDLRTQSVGEEHWVPRSQDGWANHGTSSRLSFFLGLRGPVASIDTACSSSLVAVGVAASALRSCSGGSPREALALGVSTIVTPYLYVLLSGPLMLSRKGRCFTFDEHGDGYARGEGCGAILLTVGDSSSSDVDDAGGPVAGLAGSAVNQDGRSATLTAPNGPSQSACIQASLREARAVADDVAIAECHGTGTALGDPIEVGALRRVLEPRRLPLLATSSKSNIGHLEAGAGIAGLLKCLEMWKYSCCPPNCHLRQLNPHLGVSGFAARFTTEVVAARVGDHGSLGGVSSFGFGGTNARGDVRAYQSKDKGSLKTARGRDFTKHGNIVVSCPFTLEPIDYLTGEPVGVFVSPESCRLPARSLRAQLAPYDVSPLALQKVCPDGGQYRYQAGGATGSRAPTYQDEELEGLGGISFYACGSWTGWRSLEELKPVGPGSWSITMRLGEGRYELFHIRACSARAQLGNGDRCRELYPVVDLASQRIHVVGPDEQRCGRNWLLDGRDTEVPEGTPYEIRLFRYRGGRWRVEWSPYFNDAALSADSGSEAFPRRYVVCGTWNGWAKQDMTPSSADSHEWRSHFRIGLTGREEFHLLRDGDSKQAVYPAVPIGSADGVRWHTGDCFRACGPDGFGAGRHFEITGSPGEFVRLSLSIRDAQVVVSAQHEAGAEKVWRSLSGWARHMYHVAYSLDDAAADVQTSVAKATAAPMALEPMEAVAPGRFRASIKLGGGGRCEMALRFRILVEGNLKQAFYPEAADAGSGRSIVCGPDGGGRRSCFLAPLRAARRDCAEGTVLEVTLDLLQEDLRRTVTWRWLDT
eukprot:TRINITY_DN14948_c0_g1_i1.p1 TRINITY_DN14948_c0_g1~~TRINITY_DN14948_c0_g1_i1.p1  ORF type:complete len:1433 (+),score=263.14 TRINITY_DN14948_c0_g1_i1:457-4755(+)